MNTYTIFWTPAQQSYMISVLPFLNLENAIWIEESAEHEGHFALVQALNPMQYGQCTTQCQASAIMGIKPGSNPGGSPTGCA